MKDYAIVGRKKAGKTTLAKAIAQALPIPRLVFDKNAEWGQPLCTMKDFLARAKRSRGHLLIFEDAGIFFGPTGRNDGLLDILTAARHTRNTTLLLFHSLRQVPLYVLEQLDGIWILPTNDLPDRVADRFRDFPAIVDAYERVHRARNIEGKKFPSEYVAL